MTEEGVDLLRIAGWALVVSLNVAAISGCVALASGSFGEVAWKAVATSATFGAAGVLAACGFAAMRRPRAWSTFLGAGTIAAAVATFVSLTVLLWAEIGDGALRACVALGAVAVSGACASLVGAPGRPPGAEVQPAPETEVIAATERIEDLAHGNPAISRECERIRSLARAGRT